MIHDSRFTRPQALPKIIVILGPTSVGKTALSIDIAASVGGEIVSADSRQVYKGLDIGSGKVTPEEMRGIPHHLLDVADPKTVFSVSDFVKLGREAIKGILERGNVPIVVGGTGFYIDALMGNVSMPDVPPNQGLRDELEMLSLEQLNEELEKFDPVKAETVDRKNRVRLVRAIEIAKELGNVPKTDSVSLYDISCIGLTLPREELNTRIHTRLLERFKHGMLEEAKRLHEGGLPFERMEKLGLEYRFMARHLKGELPYDEMVTTLEKEIEHYAKRQMTWFKRNKEIRWFTLSAVEGFKPEEKENALAAVKNFLKDS